LIFRAVDESNETNPLGGERMSNVEHTEEKALSAAIEMEEKGFSFFKDTAARAKDKFAKEVFEFLAAEELNHIKAIEKFHADYIAGKAADPANLIKGMANSAAKEAITHLFQQLSANTPEDGTEIEVYKFAMDFERKGEAFYQKAESEAKDPNAKKLYSFLVEEERRHFKILDSCLSYFENPAEFFHQREKWHLEG
jgi:rubrerythrin